MNALIHRDYSNAGSAMSLAIFDDRVEVWSTGTFPKGITPEALRRDHPSVLRNPIITDVFHRTGLIEKWGRGTNRVAEMCETARIAPPEFKEVTGGAVVAFRVPVSTATSTGEVTDPVADPVGRLVRLLESEPLAPSRLQAALRLKHRPTFKENYLRPALAKGLVELTIPSKPNSRLQKYRLTAAGRAALAKR